MTPVISIVVPVFNVEPYLAACLDALRAQSFSKIEIICVDDASTDNSALVLERTATLDSRIVVLKHSSNCGLPSARNTGQQAVRSPWILHVDSDDLVSKYLCERTLAAAAQYGADAVFFNYRVFHDGNPAPLESTLVAPVLADRATLLRRPAFAWTKLVRTDFLLAKKIQFPTGLCIEDIPVHWRIAIESERPVILDEPFVWYRQRAGSITYRRDWSRADGILAWDLIRNYLRSTKRWEKFKQIFIPQELANFARTHAYFALVNPSLTERVREATCARMTSEHWDYVLKGEGLSRWERDYLIACGRPTSVGSNLALLLPMLRHRLRDPLRCLWHRLGLARIL